MAQAEAEAMAALGIEEKGAVVVTAAEGWHPGVVGLVAARLKERFGRPAFAIALEPGGIGTGSGRSIAGVDLGRVVRAGGGRGAADQGRRPRHGGRRHAAQGRARAVPRLPRRARSATAVEAARRDDALLIDGALTAAARDSRDDRHPRAGRPVRRRQSEPIVALPAHTLAYADEVGQAHVRVRLRAGDGATVNAIAFRAVGQKLGAALTGRTAGARCTSRAASRSTAGRARSGCSFASATWRPLIRLRRGDVEDLRSLPRRARAQVRQHFPDRGERLAGGILATGVDHDQRADDLGVEDREHCAVLFIIGEGGRAVCAEPFAERLPGRAQTHDLGSGVLGAMGFEGQQRHAILRRRLLDRRMEIGKLVGGCARRKRWDGDQEECNAEKTGDRAHDLP